MKAPKLADFQLQIRFVLISIPVGVYQNGTLADYSAILLRSG